LTARLSFPAPPSIGAAYLRALFDRRPRRLPPGAGPVCIEAELGVVQAEPSRLAAYRDACELQDDGLLPLTYPHILAAAVHMNMLLHPEFPVRMVGLVHLTHLIELIQPIPADARLAFECRLESGRTKPRGDEFRMVTEGLISGSLAWRETMSFLAPAAVKGRRPASEPQALPPVVGKWAVPANIGRRYARVSDDWNPIHLADLLARPFGFKAAIAHGMWMVARCLGWLDQQPPGPGARLEVRFLKPLFLPASVRLHAGDLAGGLDREFFLVSTDHRTPHVRGTFRSTEQTAIAAAAS
jgi:acyl dehydratase